jgi:succinate dehydrogenase / fumarate reductase, membrane anchor subunit
MRRFTGLTAWVVQRASAVYMLAFMFFTAASLAVHPRATFLEWSAWVHSPIVAACSVLFFFALCCHMWVGLRDVLLDYAKPASLRRGLLALLAAVLMGLAGWSVIVLWSPAALPFP